MIRNIAILIGLLMLIGGYTWYDEHGRQRLQTEVAGTSTLVSEQTAPDFEFISLDDKKRNLSDFKGKVIFLNFWATWCAPCVVEFPQMVRLAADTKGKTVFIFLSLDETDEAIQRFVLKYAPHAPDNVFIARDNGKAVSQDLYQTYKLPETYIIGPDQGIEEKIIGADVKWDAVQMYDKIDRLHQGL